MAKRRLQDFVSLCWGVIDPKPYVDSWHIGCICEHLTAVSMGQIKRLMINIPPRHTKSITVSVMWPAWEWILHPEIQWLFSSYAQSLSIRDSVKCRRLIQSPLYSQLLSRYQPEFEFVDDQNTKIRFENNFGGYRLATSVDGTNTGEGGDRIVVDDPNNVREVESDTERENTNTWWDEAMSTRLNDPRTGAKVIIAQRTHEDDMCGHVMERMADEEDADAADWDLLVMPARYEGNRIFTQIGITDQREEEDEPLCPERFDDAELRVLESDLGEYGSACQLQQRPAPRGGGLFPVEQLKILEDFHPDDVEEAVRYWDKAGTEGGGAYTVGFLLLRMRKPLRPRFIIADVVREQLSASRREKRIKLTAQTDGVEVDVWVEQEPGSSGKESAENTIDMLSGYNANADRVTGDKETRAKPFASQVQIGNVGMIKAPWNRKLIQELELFPKSKYKDQADSGSGAFAKVNPAMAEEVGVWGRGPRKKKPQTRRRAA